jgi:hypothetical protein
VPIFIERGAPPYDFVQYSGGARTASMPPIVCTVPAA